MALENPRREGGMGPTLVQSGWLEGKGGMVAQLAVARDGGSAAHRGAKRGKRGIVLCYHGSNT